MVNIYLVRHGEAEGNLKGVVMGQTDYKLTDTGRNQAREAIAKFKDKKINRVIASDLSRAYKTATILAEGLGIANVEVAPQVSERHFGNMQDKNKQELSEVFKEQYAELGLLNTEAQLAYKFSVEMESAEEALTRLYSYLQHVDAEHQGENILIVTHSGLLGPFLVKQGLKKFDVPVAVGGIGNLAHINLEVDAGRVKVVGVDGIELK